MIGLTLCNREEMVFSATPATEGDHTTLGYIPGQVLWGALASRIYADGSLRARAFDLVHAGKLRVSPAFPLTQREQPAFPWPQCLQRRKHPTDEDADRRRVFNLARLGQRPAFQLEPRKGAFLAEDKSFVEPARGERGKSALTEGDRRVAQSQFFQYEHLQAGHLWRAWIDADDPSVLQEIAPLLQSGLRLGRSKLREFGGDVTVQRADSGDPRQWEGTVQNQLVLWCLSDLAVLDRFGAPDLAPQPEGIGLLAGCGRLDTVRSQISTRRFAPYNNWLSARDREAAVIEAGSVLVYHLTEPVQRAVFRAGIGLWRERGLGVVWPNPPLLEQAEFDVQPPSKRHPMPASEGDYGAPPERWQPMLLTLRARADAKQREAHTKDRTATILDRLRTAQAIAVAQGVAPGPTQWSRLAAEAETAGELAKLRMRLLGENGICVGQRNQEWRVVRPHLGQLLDELMSAPDVVVDQQPALTGIRRAAREIARTSKRRAP